MHNTKLLPFFHFKVTTVRPQMDSGQSTMSRGGGGVAKTLTISLSSGGPTDIGRRRGRWIVYVMPVRNDIYNSTISRTVVYAVAALQLQNIIIQDTLL